MCGDIVSHEIPIKGDFDFNGYKFRVACPVILSVYDSQNNFIGMVSSEIINATEGHYYDFYTCGEDNEIKIAFIAEECNVVISGVNDGTMDLTIEKYIDGEVADTLNYINIPITADTVIKTNTNMSDESRLDVLVNDEEVTFYPTNENEQESNSEEEQANDIDTTATMNETIEDENSNNTQKYIFIIIIIAIVVIIVLVIFIILIKSKKKT